MSATLETIRVGKDEKKLEKNEEENKEKKVSIAQLFRYATYKELVLLFIGIGVSLVTGAGLPLMSILQGRVTQAFVNEQMYRTNTTPGPSFHYNDTDFNHDIMNAVYGYTGMALGINLERVKEGTGDKIGLMFQYTSQFLTGFVIAFTHSWKLTLVMLAVTPLQALCGFGIAKSMSTFTIAETIKYAKAGKIVEQAISSIRTGRAVSHNGSRYKTALLEARRAGILKNLFVGISFCLMGLVNFSSFALAFYVGITWAVDGELKLQDLMTTFFSVMMGSLALGQAGPQFAVLGVAQGAAASIYEVLDREPEIDSSSKSGRRDLKIKGNIEVKDVVFNYPSRPDVPVLKKLSLSVKAGETIALVGSSGCGKSTIVSLLLRYYDVIGGEIIIDGVPISQINIEYLRNQIAVVSQEPILFNCSIEENIRLSGGQKQRIAIARALVRDPKILLLDEATSALDAESESVVQRALDKASVGRTTIIIAHRLSTIKNAHKIIAMKAGEVVEFGTHYELLANKGLYYDLINAQRFTDAVDDVDAHVEVEDHVANMRRASLVSRELSVQAVNDVQIKMRAATIMTMDGQEQDETREKKDDITRLKKGEFFFRLHKHLGCREMKDEGVKKTNLLQIFTYAKPHWMPLVVGLTACTIGGLVYPTYSVIFMQVISSFSNTSTLLSTGHFWALMFLVLAFVQGTTMFSQTFFMGLGAENLTMDLRSKLFSNILSQDMGYFDSPLHACGKICTRLASDVPNLRSGFDFEITTTEHALRLAPKVAMEAIEHVRTVQALTKEEAFHEKFCHHLDKPHRDALKESFIQGVAYG
ncbi:ABC transporter, ATP-binding protein [Necator americanus]|uniref:ABC transporter, ATP-binding protein n=1 Tax=Necator americanus TaxID=51031 RepID=W2TG46_NECAM|nr:ABC transporter, ATP-binding protein [Necator americanus]ETN80778.1 ABC transporter, ATP-binding protein [Necator americanus]